MAAHSTHSSHGHHRHSSNDHHLTRRQERQKKGLFVIGGGSVGLLVGFILSLGAVPGGIPLLIAGLVALGIGLKIFAG